MNLLYVKRNSRACRAKQMSCKAKRVSVSMQSETFFFRFLGHTLKLAKRSSRTQLRQNFFSNRVVNLWNNLPEEVVMAPPVNCFKARFDRYYPDNRYSVVWWKTGQFRQHEDRSTGILPNAQNAAAAAADDDTY